MSRHNEDSIAAAIANSGDRERLSLKGKGRTGGEKSESRGGRGGKPGGKPNGKGQERRHNPGASHEKFLRKAINDKLTVRLISSNGENIEGKIREFDAFTITITVQTRKGPRSEEIPEQDFVLFKHGLVAMTVVIEVATDE